MDKDGENWPDDIPGNRYAISVAQFRVELQLVHYYSIFKFSRHCMIT